MIALRSHLIPLLVCLPLSGEGVPLLGVQILLQVEEGVEEDGRHLAPLQVTQGDLVGGRGPNHVQHLQNKEGIY
jgi:hypothetical protein